MIFRSILAWTGILGLAILNGGFRQAVLKPRVGEQIGQLISTAMLCSFISLVAWFTIGWVHPDTAGQAWQTGLLWLCLMLAFEFGAGHYLFGKSWKELLADYNLLKGRVWVLVLVTYLVAPVWAFFQKLL
jgi:hypothetical protein